MALQVFTDLMALLWQHPVLSGLVLVLFTPPFFPIVKFFSPLLISTALFMLALFTMGGPEASSSTNNNQTPQEENWEFRRAADVKVWEDKSLFTPLRKGESASWLDWLQSIAESGYAWVEKKLQNENWKGNSLNDDNVSILQEATWASTPKSGDKDDPSSSSSGGVSEAVATTEDINVRVPAAISPAVLFKVDSELKAEHVDNAKRAVEDIGEDAPSELQTLKKSTSSEVQSLKPVSSVHHESLVSLQIPSITVTTVIDSPSTDIDNASDLDHSKRFVRRNSMNASSGSDFDTPVAMATLSNSGRLKQIETLGDLLEDKELNHELSHQEKELLKPTIAEQLEAVKEKLEGFTHSPERENKAVVTETPPNPVSSPLFKQGKAIRKVKKGSFSDEDSSSGEEELSDSDSDSEFEIFPPVDPAKMKLHPPVKLDILELEKKLGTSLSRGATPPKGEITEVQ